MDIAWRARLEVTPMHARSLFALSSLLVAAFGTSAAAHPSYGEFIDATCTANGWVPARPFNPNGADPNDPAQVDCGLCHTDAQNPSNTLTEAGSQFLASGLTDVTPFCSPDTNHAPHFLDVGPQTLTIGVPFVLNVTASDPDMDMMLLTVANAPAGSTFTDRGNGRGRFLWTPGDGDVGNHTVTFHVADTGTPMKVGTLDVPMAVDVSNHPPVLAPIGNQYVEVGAELAFSLSATDSDGDGLSYEAVGLPAGASLTGSDFRYTPDAAQLGNHDVTFTVVDTGSPPTADSEAITITVGDANAPPVLSPIGNRSAVVGEHMQIALSASDPDRDPLTLACAGLPGDALFTDLHDGTGTIAWSPSAAGSSVVTCTAADDGNPPLVAGELFTMTATAPANGPKPVLDDARWFKNNRMLRVRGHWEGGSGAGEPVAIYGVAGDQAAYLLGAGESRKGRFDIAIRPFVAPCEVAAGVDGIPGDARAVTGAPADCGVTLLTRARAELACRGDVLHVVGHRGPIGGEITLVDPGTGANLAQMPVRQRGLFSFEGNVGAKPNKVQLRAKVGGMTWLRAEPLPVRREECRWHGRQSDRGKGGRD
jgi:hypothetical protein